MEGSSHSSHKLRMLSQCENGYIGQCSCCDHYNFAYRNFLFIFTEAGLVGFQSMLYNEECLHVLETPTRNGKSVMLPSPIPNFMLTFDEVELEEVKALLQESLLVLEVDKIFAHNS